MLDEIMAIYDIHEGHEVVVHATIPQVWAALHQVALEDVPMFHALMAARELPGRLVGRPWLTAEPRRPLLEHMGSSGFVQVAERAPVETVLGLLARPWRLGGGQARVRDATSFLAFDEPGWSKAVMGFRPRRHRRRGPPPDRDSDPFDRRDGTPQFPRLLGRRGLGERRHQKGVAEGGEDPCGAGGRPCAIGVTRMEEPN